MRAAWWLALPAGGLSVLAFSPFDLFPLAFVSLGVLFALLRRARSTRQGALIGFAWGMGAFLCGVSWLYVALNRYGGVPMPLAALAIALFCAYLSLFPALVGALFSHWRTGGRYADAVLFAAVWMLAELGRGWVFTGFPWLSIGYTQTPPSPFAGYFPLLGVYGVSALVGVVSALAVTCWRGGRRSAWIGGGLVTLTMILGAGLARVAWTEAEGEPIRVALLQTAIEQDLKWRPDLVQEWLRVNAAMAAAPEADLIVLPETSLPMLVEHLPEGYLDLLAADARVRSADLVVGVFHRDEQGRIYNAAVSLGQAPSQFYAKHHLVPFGEFSPPLFGWFYEFADIPMSDQSPGPAVQAPMALAGQRVAINICYEDLFGRELIRTLPEATLMLNLSNLAWYGRSLAQPQHLQIARVRAIETGRPMLRSTNTGMTAVIQPDGRVAGVLPQFERGALEVEVRGYTGMTPYARLGDFPALALGLLGLLGGLAGRRHASHPARASFAPERESQ